MTNTVRGAVEEREQPQAPGPIALINQYAGSYRTMLPSHLQGARGEAWIRMAQAAVHKNADLQRAVREDPDSFVRAMSRAAQLGLNPGTEEFYLTPRKEKGRWGILGITGYQGLIELIYRAGAVSSVVAEVVYSNDTFRYQPGRDEVPIHEIDWDAEDRGELRLTYAYARMKDGAISRVIVLNRADIARIKSRSPSAKSDYSPWHTDEPAMWLKSGVRQLAKWVPTSAEYVREMLSAQADAARGPDPVQATAERLAPDFPSTAAPIIDGSLDDDDRPQIEAAHDQAAEQQSEPATQPKPRKQAAADDKAASQEQLTKLHATFGDVGWTVSEDKVRACSTLIGREIASTSDLTRAEASTLIDSLEKVKATKDPQAALADQLEAIREAKAS